MIKSGDQVCADLPPAPGPCATERSETAPTTSARPVELTRGELVAFCAAPLFVSFPNALVIGDAASQITPGFPFYALYSAFMAIASAYLLAMLVFLPLYVALKNRGWTSFVRVAAVYIAVLAAFQAIYLLVESWLGLVAVERVYGIIGSSPYSLYSDAGALVCLVAFWGLAYDFTRSQVGGDRLERPPGARLRCSGAGRAGRGLWRMSGRRPAVRVILRANAVLLPLFAAAHLLASLTAAWSLSDRGVNDKEARIKLSEVIMHNFTVIESPTDSCRYARECERTVNEAVRNNELAIKQYSSLEDFAGSRDFFQNIFPEEGSARSFLAAGGEPPGSAREIVRHYERLGYSALDRKMIILSDLTGYTLVTAYFVLFPIVILLHFLF